MKQKPYSNRARYCLPHTMLIISALMESKAFYNCIPDPTFIIGNEGKGMDHAVAMRASDGTYGMVYLHTGKPVIVALNKLTGEKFNAWWYDPRDGSFRLEGIFYKKPEQEFKPLEYGKDWVLVLDNLLRSEKNDKIVNFCDARQIKII